MKWSRCRGHPWTWGQGSNTPTAGFPAETYNLTLPLRWAADSVSKVSAECKARTQRVSGGGEGTPAPVHVHPASECSPEHSP